MIFKAFLCMSQSRLCLTFVNFIGQFDMWHVKAYEVNLIEWVTSVTITSTFVYHIHIHSCYCRVGNWQYFYVFIHPQDFFLYIQWSFSTAKKSWHQSLVTSRENPSCLILLNNACTGLVFHHHSNTITPAHRRRHHHHTRNNFKLVMNLFSLFQ